jgi:hypothetical protein
MKNEEFFGRAASRAIGALASGYPLHHLLRRFAATQVVPLLSLSLRGGAIQSELCLQIYLYGFYFGAYGRG